jgi:hypothetical protein
MNDKYELIRAGGDGHHVWRHWPTGRIAVSDQSADYNGRPGDPEATDDGALFVDFTRELRRITTRVSSRALYMVPVRTARGELRHTPAHIEEIHTLEALHGARFGEQA